MNPSDQPPPPLPDETGTAKPKFKPMDGSETVTQFFETLLKHPGSIIHRMHQGNVGRPILLLTGIAAVSFLVFGALIGTFALGSQLWATPLKMTGGILFSALICLPSLYSFTCLSGLSARFSSIAGVLSAVVALTGLLLLGFSPVVWIFTQSTTSPIFMGGLVLVFWVISLGVGLSLLPKMVSFTNEGGSPYLRIWIVIFIVVTLQMSTSLRPLIAPEDDSPFLPTEKKFFLEHWIDEASSR